LIRWPLRRNPARARVIRLGFTICYLRPRPSGGGEHASSSGATHRHPAGSNPNTSVSIKGCSRPPGLRSTAPDGFSAGGVVVRHGQVAHVARQLGPNASRSMIQVPLSNWQEHFVFAPSCRVPGIKVIHSIRSACRDISDRFAGSRGQGACGVDHAPDHIRTW